MILWQDLYDKSLEWLVKYGFQILLIIFGAFIVRFFLSKIIERAVRRFIGSPKQDLSKLAEEKRENTLIRILDGASRVLIWIIAVLMILSNIGVEIGPLLAAAGIVGIAVGFGGQYLIKDLISGFFIIIENQYRVGDVVKLGDIGGLVEDISLRMTTLRDLDGVVHHVPHGVITKVSNLSKGFSRVNLNVSVSYESDLDFVIEVINRVGNDFANDTEWSECITKAPQFLRVDNLGESAIDMRILGDTIPMKQWEVTGELRRRLKKAFDKEGIVMPYPQRTISYLDKNKD